MIHFIVDSTFCVDEEYKKQHDIKMVNLTILLDGKTYHEDNMETWPEYFEALKASKSFPKTTQPSPEDFSRTIDNILKQDENSEIIILTFTQLLSGTYNCARMVAEEYNGKVTVIDSENSSESSLLLLEELVEARDQGKSVKELVELATELKTKLSIQFVPSTLEYLKRGGRINKVTSIIANMLNLKPIIHLKQGILSSAKKCLGVKKAIKEMVSGLVDKVKKCYVVYVYESQFLNDMVEAAKKAFNGVKLKIRSVSPVVASHVGIGAVGIACLEK